MEIFVNFRSVFLIGVFVILLTVNFIFLVTIILMWIAMSSNVYLRKNEYAMVTKFILDLLYSSTQLLATLVSIKTLRESINDVKPNFE